MSEEQARVYTISLSRVYDGRRRNRASRALRLLYRRASRIARNLYKDAERVIIDNSVNEYIWSRGREKPPRRISFIIEYNEKEKTAVIKLPSKKP